MQQRQELDTSREREGRDTNQPQRRQLIDGQGDYWDVYEFGPRRRTGREVPPVLIFETSTRWRRVQCYPADWAELADDALFELSRHP